MTSRFVAATRELHGLTARLEARVLRSIALRLPAWIHADHLTTLAASAMVAAAGAYVWARAWPPALHLVNLCLLLNWLGDSLDGTVARLRDQQRPRYGFYVDHVLDSAGASLLVLGMAAAGLLSLPLALALLAAYLLLSVEVYLATYCLGSFRMSFLGMGATELRLVLALGHLAALRSPTATVAGQTWLLFDVGAAVAIPALVIAFLTAAVRNAWALSRAEPRPPARSCRYAPPPPSDDARRQPARAETARESPA